MTDPEIAELGEKRQREIDPFGFEDFVQGITEKPQFKEAMLKLDLPGCLRLSETLFQADRKLLEACDLALKNHANLMAEQKQKEAALRELHLEKKREDQRRVAESEEAVRHAKRLQTSNDAARNQEKKLLQDEFSNGQAQILKRFKGDQARHTFLHWGLTILQKHLRGKLKIDNKQSQGENKAAEKDLNKIQLEVMQRRESYATWEEEEGEDI